MKKLLLVANVSKEHIRKFHIPFIMEMTSKGWQVDVACRLDAPIPECHQAYDLPCDRNPFRGGIVKSIFIIRQLLRKNQYDVIHCHTITGSLVARIAAAPFRKKGLKVFYTNHGLHFFPGAPWYRWAIGYPMEKFLAHKTDLLITINQEDYETAHHYLKECKSIEQIHGIGVDLQRFYDAAKNTDRNSYRKQLGLCDNDIVITYVAELNKNKNQESLIKVFSILQQKLPNAKLMLVGPDHYNGKIQTIAAKAGISDHVLFLGWRNDVPQLLSISDIYAATSYSEGLGLNIIEAMACHLPVVAFMNRGHNEIIQDNITGYLINPDDVSTMADKICMLANDHLLVYTMTQNAQNTIIQYETSHVLRCLNAIYDKYTSAQQYS